MSGEKRSENYDYKNPLFTAHDIWSDLKATGAEHDALQSKYDALLLDYARVREAADDVVNGWQKVVVDTCAPGVHAMSTLIGKLDGALKPSAPVEEIRERYAAEIYFALMFNSTDENITVTEAWKMARGLARDKCLAVADRILTGQDKGALSDTGDGRR